MSCISKKRVIFFLMMNDIAPILRQKGLKKTALRRAILEIFSSEQSPATITRLQKKLKEKGLSPNKTSLYRQAETLTRAEILSETPLKNGVMHYELKRTHHHHFQCNSCGDISCIHDDTLETAIQNAEISLQKNGVSVKLHEFSFSGNCSVCEKNIFIS